MTSSMIDRYAKAEALRDPQSLVRNRVIEPRWTGDGDTLTYQRTKASGDVETIRIDPLTTVRTIVPAAAALPPPGAAEIRSAAGHLALFVHAHDLWLRDLPTGREKRLTDDGEMGFSWGALPDHCMVRIPIRTTNMLIPPALTGFSPSGRRVLTARLDERSLPVWPFVQHLPPEGARPVLHPIRFALDGEERETNYEVLLIDLETGERTPIDLPSGALATLTEMGVDILAWNADESSFWLLAHTTGDRTAELLQVDTATGRHQVIVTETDERVYEPNQFLYSLPLVRVVPELDRVIWFSQRDGWGHLYQYALTTGESLGALTSGEIVVRDLLRVDPAKGEILFLAGTAEGGRNPYWRALYRAFFDGRPMELLTPEECDHELPSPQPALFRLIYSPGAEPVDPISPSGRFCVDHMSTVGTPPIIVLRDLTDSGRVVCELERTDDSALRAAGFVPPVPFCVKADDGVTDLWGVLCLPPDPVDPTAIPVIDLMYAGFQTTWQPSGYPGPQMAGSLQPGFAYGQLGFATVVLDGRGTPGRHRDFRTWTQGQVDERRGLQDHVTAITSLAADYPQLDLTRVGVTGFSYGGYNSARSILLFPDFFTVAVSGGGVHDPTKMPHGMWQWHTGPDVDKTSELYTRLGNLHLADRLQGKLLVSFGELDENATLDHSLALIQALIDAGKRFDMKLWPGANHYTQTGPYMLRAAWDYFIEHLLGLKAPEG